MDLNFDGIMTAFLVLDDLLSHLTFLSCGRGKQTSKCHSWGKFKKICTNILYVSNLKCKYALSYTCHGHPLIEQTFTYISEAIAKLKIPINMLSVSFTYTKSDNMANSICENIPNKFRLHNMYKKVNHVNYKLYTM